MPHPAGPCGGARSRFLKSPRCGGRERPPYGTGKNTATTRQGASPQGPREGHGPPLQTGGDAQPPGKPRPCVITNLCRGRFHIGPARGGTGPCGRDASSRRTLRWRKVPRADKESRPYDQRRVCGRPGKCQPHAAATSVGDDACIVPGTSWQRKRSGRDLRPKSRRCAAVGLRNAPAGAVNPAPTNKFCVLDKPEWPPPPGRP